MSRRRPPFPVAVPIHRNGFRQPPAIPISRLLTIKSIGVMSLTPIPAPPGMPETGKFVAELVMVKSDGTPVHSKTELHEGMDMKAVVLEIHNGFQWLQTFLNCPCTPQQSCQMHRPAVEDKQPVPPPKILLTDG